MTNPNRIIAVLLCISAITFSQDIAIFASGIISRWFSEGILCAVVAARTSAVQPERRQWSWQDSLYLKNYATIGTKDEVDRFFLKIDTPLAS